MADKDKPTSLDELSAAWNGLRNAALGRGTSPNVSPALAADVSRAYDEWREWLQHAPPIADVLAHAMAHNWVKRYRALVARVQREGQTPTDVLPVTSVEASLKVAEKLQSNIAWGLVGTGVGVALFFAGKLWGRRRD